MIRLLKIALITVLFIVSKICISKAIGKRARRIIFDKTDVSSNKHIIKTSKADVLLALGIFLLTILNGYKVLEGIIFSIIAIGLLYGLRFIKKGAKKKQVLCDLLNISECLRVQISSQIPLSNALRTLPELCENKELSVLINNVYLEYELSKFTIIDSGNTLIDKFNYPEIRIFISALNQQIQSTSAVEAFDNLIAMLREKYIEFLEDSTKSKMAIMTMGVFIIVLNIAAIGIYPVAVETFYAINIMLK